MYPDVLIACGEISNEDTSIKRPVVIFEILSKGTSRYDSGAKFLKYQTIASLRHYVLVSQDDIAVQHYSRRADGQWADYEVISGPDGTLELSAVAISIRLADVYRNVPLAAPQTAGDVTSAADNGDSMVGLLRHPESAEIDFEPPVLGGISRAADLE